ncbi:MAG: proline iminopeptidase-family hydrolase [Ktedonobacteraceae bacterium]|nr:proline iminopeptidase-family hydrolase [Ktedonobacteraceae bacterium]
MSIREHEGYISVEGYKVWYRSVGGGVGGQEQTPILTLHGGPGVPSAYIEDMAQLASDTRRVIFYDQLGCGHSDRPDNPAMWTIQRFVDELAMVRKALGLAKIHLWGQSWGGMLAIEYALTQPQGMESLTLASTSSSMPTWIAEANRLRDELPEEIQNTLLRHEAAGTTDDPEYQTAMLAFYERHVIRIVPMPPQVARAFDTMGQQVYFTMNGPSEFHVVGVIKDWERTNRLHEIKVPTLITSGFYDESTPLINETMQKEIAGSEWVLFKHSSHMAHVEEMDLYMQVMRNFLHRVENTTGGV